MTTPSEYARFSLPVKYFLSSYRALSDGRAGIAQLEELLKRSDAWLSEWKVTWIGTCAVVRAAAYLMPVDAKSCLIKNLRAEIRKEYDEVSRNRDQHAIFWCFLKHERDAILKDYQWRAYETWLRPDGTYRDRQPLLLMTEEDGARPLLRMKGGPFDGRDSLELLKEGADWVEARLFAAIRAAGFDPDERRGIGDLSPPKRLAGSFLNPIDDTASE